MMRAGAAAGRIGASSTNPVCLNTANAADAGAAAWGSWSALLTPSPSSSPPSLCKKEDPSSSSSSSTSSPTPMPLVAVEEEEEDDIAAI